MRRTTVVYSAIVLSVAAGLITGCGSAKEGAAPAASASGQTAPSVKPTNTGPRDMTVYSIAAAYDQKMFDSVYGDYIRKKFPDVKLTFVSRLDKGNSLNEVLAAGLPIDIEFDSIGFQYAYRDSGLAMDMTPLIKAKNLDLSRFEQSSIDFQKHVANGAIDALPVWTSTAGLFYNKDIFDKFGVSYPKDNMTWTQVYNLAKQLTRQENGVQYIGYVPSQTTQANTNSLGLKYIDPKTGKAQLDNDDWRNFMGSITQFFTIPGPTWTAKTANISAMRAMFEKDRTAAMYTNESGGTPPADMNWDVVTLPTYEQAPGVGAQQYPNFFAVTSKSRNKELAFDIVASLLSDEYQLWETQQGRASVLNDKNILKHYGEADPKFKGKNISALFPAKHAEIGPYSPEDSIANQQFGKAFISIVTKEKDLVTAMRDANEEANKQIQTLHDSKK